MGHLADAPAAVDRGRIRGMIASSARRILRDPS
jgi:hypothetical protein